MTKILGILNVTRDSFSDGGRYLHADAAVAHARQMVADGADIIDIGAESTHPDAEDVSANEEIARLTPVIERLKAAGIHVSVDTYKPAVMWHVLGLGVDFINDVTALRDPKAVAAVREADARLIIMHSTASTARAQRVEVDPVAVIDRIVAFFKRRVRELEQAGIARERLILDPGMGMFLGSNPARAWPCCAACPGWRLWAVRCWCPPRASRSSAPCSARPAISGRYLPARRAHWRRSSGRRPTGRRTSARTTWRRCAMR